MVNKLHKPIGMVLSSEQRRYLLFFVALTLRNYSSTFHNSQASCISDGLRLLAVFCTHQQSHSSAWMKTLFSIFVHLPTATCVMSFSPTFMQWNFMNFLQVTPGSCITQMRNYFQSFPHTHIRENSVLWFVFPFLSLPFLPALQLSCSWIATVEN